MAQPGADVSGTAVLGMPADVLITMAGHAALVVVGSRGDHGFASALLGSVALKVAKPRTLRGRRGTRPRGHGGRLGFGAGTRVEGPTVRALVRRVHVADLFSATGDGRPGVTCLSARARGHRRAAR
jgi:hypothetical protein